MSTEDRRGHLPFAQLDSNKLQRSIDRTDNTSHKLLSHQNILTATEQHAENF